MSRRDVCEQLLEADADADHSDGAGRCALFAAASMGHHAVVQLLLPILPSSLSL